MRKNISQSSKSNPVGVGLRWLFLATTLFTTPSFANIYTFSTAINAKDTALEPVSAEAIFDISAGSMTVTLVNFQSNITSIGQNISSLLFTVNNGSSILSLANAKATISGSEVQIGSAGTSSAGMLTNAVVGATGTTSGHWSAGQNGSQAYLNDLNGGGAPDQTIIGPADSNGNYATVNHSIYGNGQHNPFIQKQAIFKIVDAGLLTTSTVSGTQIGYGTTPVPEPGSLALFAIGVAALARTLRWRPGDGSS